MELQKAILILIEIVEHMEAFLLLYIVHHIVIQELVDVIGTDLAKAHSIDSLEGGPWLKALLLGQLLALLLHYLLVLTDWLQKQVYFVTGWLTEHLVAKAFVSD